MDSPPELRKRYRAWRHAYFRGDLQLFPQECRALRFRPLQAPWWFIDWPPVWANSQATRTIKGRGALRPGN
ncbi:MULTISPECIES: hypothetical protein [unclassified Halomonas]|uniref:hypothetical protein n=1 Tax=unclassified Halomonas TaxID=2609666 RepID=UPI00403321C6